MFPKRLKDSFISFIALVSTGSNYWSTSKMLKIFRILNFTFTMTYRIEVKYFAKFVQSKLLIRVHSFDNGFVMFTDK